MTQRTINCPRERLLINGLVDDRLDKALEVPVEGESLFHGDDDELVFW